jgi:hypothetical protein
MPLQIRQPRPRFNIPAVTVEIDHSLAVLTDLTAKSVASLLQRPPSREKLKSTLLRVTWVTPTVIAGRVRRVRHMPQSASQTRRAPPAAKITFKHRRN